MKQAILGADFFRHFGLLLDFCQHKLHNSVTNLYVSGLQLSPPISSTGLLCDDSMFSQLLAEFPVVTEAVSTDRPIKHIVTHHSQTVGQPVSSRTRRLAPERLTLDRNSITCSNWVSFDFPPATGPLHSILFQRSPLVIGDHEVTTLALNRVTVPDCYPLPHL